MKLSIRHLLKSSANRELTKKEIYVGTTLASARLQFNFLIDLGMNKDSSVLEIGCGALHAASHLVPFLDSDKYVGIDPNQWLRNDLLSQAKAWKRLQKKKKPLFSSVEDFDVSYLDRKYDFILSHSVLSHAGYSQLPEFLKNARSVLKIGGKALVSVRLSEGNAYGSEGTPDKQDSGDLEWVYPGVSYFSLTTFRNVAENYNFQVEVNESFTKRLVDFRKSEYHDWLVLTGI